MSTSSLEKQCNSYSMPRAVGWALLGVKIETSMNRLATFHKVGPGRGEHDGEKSFRIGSLICPAVCARSYTYNVVTQKWAWLRKVVETSG